MVIDIIQNRAHGGKAHLVGISLGAQIIVQILSTTLGVVDHAVISGALVRRIPGTVILPKLLNLMFKAYMPFRNIDFLIKMNMKYNGIPSEYFEEVKRDSRLITADSINRIITENMSFRIPETLCRAKNPALIIVGEKEYDIMHKSARDLNKCLQNSEAYMASNLGHSWSLESPELFNSVARAWINDKPLPEEAVPLRL